MMLERYPFKDAFLVLNPRLIGELITYVQAFYQLKVIRVITPNVIYELPDRLNFEAIFFMG